MKNIDALTDHQVYADPVRKIQEEMLRDLLLVREQMAKSIEDVCQSGGSVGGGGGGLGIHGEGEDKTITVKLDEYDKLKSGLAKAQNQIIHLKRTIVEIEGGDPSSVGKAASAPAVSSQIDSNEQVTIQYTAQTGCHNVFTNLI